MDRGGAGVAGSALASATIIQPAHARKPKQGRIHGCKRMSPRYRPRWSRSKKVQVEIGHGHGESAHPSVRLADSVTTAYASAVGEV